MGILNLYKNKLRIPPPTPTRIKPRFSLTTDILSFRTCSRQYGFFGNDGFVPAHSAQIFYGTIIHQVLDRCHRHYSGLMGHPKGSMPTDSDIDLYFGEVENALRAHGVRPPSPSAAHKAKKVIKIFNKIEGPELYPRVFDTEYRLESDREKYILRGVVDVIASSTHSSNDPGQMEIWDYKGTYRPGYSSKTLKDYRYQMCIYAELYKAKSGSYPAKGVLYFLNELDLDPVPTERPRRALHEVSFKPSLIAEAMASFDKTAIEIIKCRLQKKWPLPEKEPDKATCDICDKRWDCPVVQYKIRYPF